MPATAMQTIGRDVRRDVLGIAILMLAGAAPASFASLDKTLPFIGHSVRLA
jgi:hypothetical protein